MSDLKRATEICRLLDVTYNQPDLGNYTDPVDELIYILLSIMTTEANYQRAYAALRARFSEWDRVLEAPYEEVRETIRIAGLAPKKARSIQDLLGRLIRDWDTFDLSFMRTWPTVEIRRYLDSLPGIGYKAATCVAAYSFGCDVCPVDTHTYRVAVRLGLISADVPEIGRRAHTAIEQVLPAGERLAFHINAIAHGRDRCKLERPRCDGCPVMSYCVAPKQGRYSRRQPRSLADDSLDVNAER